MGVEFRSSSGHTNMDTTVAKIALCLSPLLALSHGSLANIKPASEPLPLEKSSGPYHPPIEIQHSQAPYNPTPPPHYGPSPTPHYGPSPAPYAPHVPHHPGPVYGYSPAPPPYGAPPSYGYTPAPQYGYQPHAPAHQPYAPRSPLPPHHLPQPHHPAPPHHPKPHHDGPPACSKNTTKTWCLEDADYPTYEISHAIEYNYAGVAALYKDVLANTENSVDRLVELPQETYLCPSVTGYLMPLRAINTAGKWRIVVNGVKAHYETLTQTARVEEYTTAGRLVLLCQHAMRPSVCRSQYITGSWCMTLMTATSPSPSRPSGFQPHVLATTELMQSLIKLNIQHSESAQLYHILTEA